jgi:Flp pilus assembly pilin Flp
MEIKHMNAQKRRLFAGQNRRRRGQAVTEYATVLAFVAFIVAFAFSLARGTLFAAISDAYSGTAASLSAMNQAVADHH